MFTIDKMSPILLRMNLPQICTIYDIQALQKLSEDFQENILDKVILAYNRYSDQSVYNLTLKPVFSGEIFENGQLWTAASEQSEIAACNVMMFFYNVTLNVNIEFSKFATVLSIDQRFARRVLAFRVQVSSRPESKRSGVQIQASRFQAPRVQLSRVQASTRLESIHPESKRPVVQSPSVQSPAFPVCLILIQLCAFFSLLNQHRVTCA